MRVVKDLKIPQDDFFELIKKSMNYDISLHSKKKAEEGITYEKILRSYRGKERSVQISIISLSKDLVRFITQSNHSKIITTYQIEPLNDGINVAYTEHIETPKLLERLNYSIMSFMYRKSNREKMYSQWMKMEQYYLDSN